MVHPILIPFQFRFSGSPVFSASRSIQDLSAERGLLEQQKQELEAVLLTAKLQASRELGSTTKHCGCW